jgi:hypothetical protein
MGRILFLSAVAYLAYRYIGRSNKKAKEIAAGTQEILPPLSTGEAGVSRPSLPKTAATELLPASKHPVRSSSAAESSAEHYKSA